MNSNISMITYYWMSWLLFDNVDCIIVRLIYLVIQNFQNIMKHIQKECCHASH